MSSELKRSSINSIVHVLLNVKEVIYLSQELKHHI